jgi:hypothetical protein
LIAASGKVASCRLYPGLVSRFRQTGVQKGDTPMGSDPIIVIGNFLPL